MSVCEANLALCQTLGTCLPDAVCEQMVQDFEDPSPPAFMVRLHALEPGADPVVIQAAHLVQRHPRVLLYAAEHLTERLSSSDTTMPPESLVNDACQLVLPHVVRHLEEARRALVAGQPVQASGPPVVDYVHLLDRRCQAPTSICPLLDHVRSGRSTATSCHVVMTALSSACPVEDPSWSPSLGWEVLAGNLRALAADIAHLALHPPPSRFSSWSAACQHTPSVVAGDTWARWRELEEQAVAAVASPGPSSLAPLSPPQSPPPLGPSLQRLGHTLAMLELGGTVGEGPDDDQGEAGPGGAEPVGGGRCGMFRSDFDQEDEEGNEGEAKSTGLSQTPPPSSSNPAAIIRQMTAPVARTGQGETIEGERLFEEEDAPLAEGRSVEDRVIHLERMVQEMAGLVAQLVKGEGSAVRPSPPSPPPPARVHQSAEAVTHQLLQSIMSGVGSGGLAEGEAKREAVESMKLSTQALSLQTAHQTSRRQGLKQGFPWMVSAAVTHDRGLVVGAAMRPYCGQPRFTSVGQISSVRDLQVLYQEMANPTVTFEECHRFTRSPALAAGTVLCLWGGNGTCTCRVEDLQSPGPGEELSYIIEDESLYRTAPGPRITPASKEDFRQQARALAWVMGLFLGERVTFEAYHTINELVNRCRTHPQSMCPAMATYLFNSLVWLYINAWYHRGLGEPVPFLGTEPVPTEHEATYKAKGWSTEGPTMIASMASPFMRRQYLDPLLEATVTTKARRGLLRQVGACDTTVKPPTGGPSGAAQDQSYLTLKEYNAATSAFDGACAHGAPCFAHMSAKGCSRKKCSLIHYGIAASTLAGLCKSSPALRLVMTQKGGPSARDVSGVAMGPLVGPSDRAGAAQTQSDGESSDEDGASPVSGGKTSGVQVPYMLYVGPYYRKKAFDYHSWVDAQSRPLVRPSAIHPDGPVQPFDGTFPPLPSRGQVRLARVGQSFISLPSNPRGDRFSLVVAGHNLTAYEAGQVVHVGQARIANSCVMTTFGAVLGVDASALYEDTMKAAAAAAASLGPPADHETRSAAMVRAVCHDVLSALDGGHPLDSLIFAYFPPEAIHSMHVLVVQTSGGGVAIDVLSGEAAGHQSPWAVCLQRRGNPGHIQPVEPVAPDVVHHILTEARSQGVPVRRTVARGWRAIVDADLGGPSAPWALHRLCDFCSRPRFPLPPLPAF